MIGLLQALFSTLWGHEPQPEREGDGARPAANVVKLENESASPVTKKVSQPDYADEIQRLEAALYGGQPLQSGFCIEITLRDLLDICPRKRRRSDAYNGLINTLNKRDVSLIITKNKR